MIKRQAFEDAISCDEDDEPVNYEDIKVSDYSGPKIENIGEVTSEWVQELMEYQKG